MTDKPRELTQILYDIDSAMRALRHARLGLTPEDSLEAMRRLAMLAKELEVLGHQLREAASSAKQ